MAKRNSRNTRGRIVSAAGLDAADRVIEVGPGLGSLTLALLALSGWLAASHSV